MSVALRRDSHPNYFVWTSGYALQRVAWPYVYCELGLRNVPAVRRLNDSHHKHVKKNRLQPALCWHAMTPNYQMLTASVNSDCFKGICRTPYILIGPPTHVSNPFLRSIIHVLIHQLLPHPGMSETEVLQPLPSK